MDIGSIEKLISLLIALIYLIIAIFFAIAEARLMLFIIAFLFVSSTLALIWFSENIAVFTQSFGVFSRPINSESPPVLVRIFGWLWLLAPGVIFIIKGIYTLFHYGLLTFY